MAHVSHAAHSQLGLRTVLHQCGAIQLTSREMRLRDLLLDAHHLVILSGITFARLALYSITLNTMDARAAVHLLFFARLSRAIAAHRASSHPLKRQAIKLASAKQSVTKMAFQSMM